MISQAFFVQVNSNKDVPLKVSTGEIESVGTIKHFNKKRIQMNEIKYNNENEKWCKKGKKK